MDWFEDDAFWTELYPFLFCDSRMERVEADADLVMELTGIGTGTLLDLCCGPGRFSAAMARRGFRVTGVDRSEYLLGAAGERARIEDIESIDWVNSDMRDFRRPGAFDLALCMFTSFGYFHTHEENRAVLSNLCGSLRPGGQLVLEVMGKETLASIFTPVSCDELDDGSILVQKHSIENGWRRIQNSWILIRDDQVSGRWEFSHWVYSAVELEGMLLEAGFDFVSTYGGLDGSPYDDSARRLVVVAGRGS